MHSPVGNTLGASLAHWPWGRMSLYWGGWEPLTLPIHRPIWPPIFCTMAQHGAECTVHSQYRTYTITFLSITGGFIFNFIKQNYKPKDSQGIILDLNMQKYVFFLIGSCVLQNFLFNILFHHSKNKTHAEFNVSEPCNWWLNCSFLLIERKTLSAGNLIECKSKVTRTNV